MDVFLTLQGLQRARNYIVAFYVHSQSINHFEGVHLLVDFCMNWRLYFSKAFRGLKVSVLRFLWGSLSVLFYWHLLRPVRFRAVIPPSGIFFRISFGASMWGLLEAWLMGRLDRVGVFRVVADDVAIWDGLPIYGECALAGRGSALVDACHARVLSL